MPRFMPLKKATYSLLNGLPFNHFTPCMRVLLPLILLNLPLKCYSIIEKDTFSNSL